MSDDNEFGSFLAGFVIGGLVGAAVALLYAPQSGEETRTMIKDKGIELKDRAVEYSHEAQARAGKTWEAARAKVEVALEDLRTRTNELAQVTKDWAASVQHKGGGEIEAVEPPAESSPTEA